MTICVFINTYVTTICTTGKVDFFAKGVEFHWCVLLFGSVDKTIKSGLIMITHLFVGSQSVGHVTLT